MTLLVATAQRLLLACAVLAAAEPNGSQKPLTATAVDPLSPAPRKLTGRFLHITDFHPDQFYQARTAVDKNCHGGRGHAGRFGTEVSSCDSPFSLVNATLDWIGDNLRDDIDFVVWTGDNARHDNDEKYPRSREQVLGANRAVAAKMHDTFSPNRDGLEIPIVPTFGNNDFLPHNIMLPGPNSWLVEYADIWGPFVPEEQRHQFEYGGWFRVPVVPGRLVVFSLNTMFFFDRNAAVDGCALPSEPGYKHMEWLRVQLQQLREAGTKAILMGHVPPARTADKHAWDETCWQRYTLWLRQYRDVIVGSLYGHMNIDHFILQDTHDIDGDKIMGAAVSSSPTRESMDVSIQGRTSYLEDVRKQWSKLPSAAGHAAPSKESDDESSLKKKKKKKKKKTDFKDIGGKYAERYHVSVIGPSVVPNYFPTLRVYEYNITGIEDNPVWKDVYGSPSTIQGAKRQRGAQQPHAQQPHAQQPHAQQPHAPPEFSHELRRRRGEEAAEWNETADVVMSGSGGRGGARVQGRKKRGRGRPSLVVPKGPDADAPPGPAHMAQTLSWVAFTQYFANLTRINGGAKDEGRPVQFEVEYDTRDDGWYRLKDLTVRQLVKLAHDIGLDEASELKRKKGKKKKGKKNRLWVEFLRRAFVGTLDDAGLERLQV